MSYVLEYAKSDKSSCTGKKDDCPSENYKIAKGELRLGVEVPNTGGSRWRHWVCVTSKVIENMQKDYSSPDQIQGWEDLRPEDQERVQRAWDEGEIPQAERPTPAAEHVRPVKKKMAELPATNEPKNKKKSTKTSNAESSTATVKDEEKATSLKDKPEVAKKETAVTGSRKSSRAVKTEEASDKESSSSTTNKKPTIAKKAKAEVTDKEVKDDITEANPKKKSPTSKASGSKKEKAIADEPKVAAFATRNKTVKNT
ncbi:uncharacterized protein EV154DRAFT_209362 [Mucor mucedo]|uniref:uncharacterized protein n=1 Tax=Mucor mucedo TaxID=29922 RepID=UPI00221EF8D0|nr:uncharacterized protein EV154DRAFT_209362 [Mucor mucedo]KAI7891908.1 hypothetical protein EV154DRAFT_209362 [Mucor mucedo]